MPIISCTFHEHAPAILDIFNEAIANSTALYDYKPRQLASMENWFNIKTANQFPVIGMSSEQGELLGFASYGTFRNFPAYKYSVEHSVYVHHQHRGKGIGPQLMRELITLAKKQERHVLIGAIDAANTASIAMHRKLGFSHAGTIKQAGFKFGRWLDLAFYQLILSTPHEPCDG